jgi:hypothetical protein
MNDPGLEEPIKQTANDVENVKEDHVANEDPDGVDDDDEAYLEPSRWWIASTAIPLIAVSLGEAMPWQPTDGDNRERLGRWPAHSTSAPSQPSGGLLTSRGNPEITATT